MRKFIHASPLFVFLALSTIPFILPVHSREVVVSADLSIDPIAQIYCSTPVITTVAWSPNGERLACGSEAGTFDIWDVGSWQHIQEVQAHEEWTYSIAWSPDEKYVASIGKDNKLSLWDVETITNTASFDVDILDESGAGFGSKVEWNLEGSKVGSIPLNHGRIQIWDVLSSAKLMDILTGPSADWSSDGETLAVANDDRIQVWDVNTSEILFTFRDHIDVVKALQWTSDNTMLASASADASVRVWDAYSGESLKVLQHSQSVVNVVWSPDSTKLASVSSQRIGTKVDNHIHIWDFQTGEELVDLQVDQPMIINPLTVSWSPDGRSLMAESRVNPLEMQALSWLWLWDASTGAALNVLKPSDEQFLSQPSWHPVGSMLLGILSANQVMIWDTEDLIG